MCDRNCHEHYYEDTLIPKVGIITGITQETPDVKTFKVNAPEGGKLFDNQKVYLAGLKNCTFTVIGGESAVSAKMLDIFSGYGETTRLAGSNRFETSVLVAEKYFPNATSAVLAYAWDFPDGLCGGGLANAMNAPLILTMTHYESQAADYIQRRGIRSGVVLGGEGLISEQSVQKIFGAN